MTLRSLKESFRREETEGGGFKVRKYGEKKKVETLSGQRRLGEVELGPEPSMFRGKKARQGEVERRQASDYLD